MPSTTNTDLLNQTGVVATQYESTTIVVQPIATNIVVVTLDSTRKYVVRHLGHNHLGASAIDVVAVGIKVAPTDVYTAVTNVRRLSVGDVFYPRLCTGELQLALLTTVGGVSEVMVEIAVIESILGGMEA